MFVYSSYNCAFRPSSHGNAIVPFHLRSNFWKGQIGCSHRNGTIAYQFCFALRRERNRSVDMFSICLCRRERNGTIAYCSTFRITFLIVPFFGKERFYFKQSLLNAALQRFTCRIRIHYFHSLPLFTCFMMKQTSTRFEYIPFISSPSYTLDN